MKTREDIINTALRKAKMSRASGANLEAYIPEYDLHLAVLLKAFPYPFQFQIIMPEELEEVSPEVKLGFKYSYRLNTPNNSDILEILSLHRDSSFPALSASQARRFGLNFDPRENGIDTNPRRDYIFVGGILHTNTVPTEILAKRVPDPSIFSPEFKLYLIYTLASELASEVKKDDVLHARLQRQALEACKEATSFLVGTQTDPQYAAIVDYIKRFYTVSSLGY